MILRFDLPYKSFIAKIVIKILVMSSAFLFRTAFLSSLFLVSVIAHPLELLELTKVVKPLKPIKTSFYPSVYDNIHLSYYFDLSFGKPSTLTISKAGIVHLEQAVTGTIVEEIRMDQSGLLPSMRTLELNEEVLKIRAIQGGKVPNENCSLCLSSFEIKTDVETELFNVSELLNDFFEAGMTDGICFSLSKTRPKLSL